MMASVRRRPAFTLIEIVVAAMVIGSSALMIIELIRSSTASLEVTEYEAAVRTLASDVMTRLTGPKQLPYDPFLLQKASNGAPQPTTFVNAPVPYETFLKGDPALNINYPAELKKLLDITEAKVRVHFESPWQGTGTGDTAYPNLGQELYQGTPPATFTGVELYTVSVEFIEPRNKEQKEVKLVRLVATE